jgi:hypothetical protein
MIMKRTIVAVGSALSLTLLACPVTAKERDSSKLPPASDKKDVTYSRDIKPIFEKTCLECHGQQKAKGKIRLDSVENILKGGEEGKIITVGDSAKSVIAYAVARNQAKAMPPKDKGHPLNAEQVGLIRAWIDQGAK